MGHTIACRPFVVDLEYLVMHMGRRFNTWVITNGKLIIEHNVAGPPGECVLISPNPNHVNLELIDKCIEVYAPITIILKRGK